MPAVGVLALQGDFAAHARVLREAGAAVSEVRRTDDLFGLDGLVLPGGESTTMLKLMGDATRPADAAPGAITGGSWREALLRFHQEGGALFGTCAGAILLAREVRDPAQPALGLLDVAVARNAYGRQLDSFEARLDAPSLGGELRGVFIRAPRFMEVGPRVEVLARHAGEPVLVRQGRVLAATFHPELAGEGRIHRLFLEAVGGRMRVV